jgi:hypothetical protein
MMAFLSLNDIIPKILEVVNFEEYLLHDGYIFMPNKKIKGFEAFVKKNLMIEDEVIFLGYNTDNQTEIYYSMLFNDQGNIIDFVKNRIEFDNTYETFEPTKDSLIEACKKLVEYINIKGEKKDKINLETKTEDFYLLKKETFSLYYKARKVYDFDFLNHYKIPASTIEHPIFLNCIYNTNGFITNGITANDTVNMAYPLIDENKKECGFFFENLIRNQEKKLEIISFFAPGSLKSGLWISNKLENTSATNAKITLVSNPKEALAHFSYLKENRLYIAPFDIDESTYAHINSLLNRYHSSIYLASDVSVPNFIAEIKIVISVINAKKQIDLFSFEKEFYDHIVIKLNVGGTSFDDDIIENFMNRIKRHNASKISTIKTILGNKAINHLQNDLIVPKFDQQQNIVFKIPKNLNSLYNIEQFIIKSFAFSNFYIEKPMHFSWTKQWGYFNEILDAKSNQEEENLLEKYATEEFIFTEKNTLLSKNKWK